MRARLAESLERVGAPTDDDLQTALLALRRETGERAQASLARLLADHLVRIPEAEAELTRRLDGSERLRRDLAMRDVGILRERRSGGSRVAPGAGRR